MTLGVCVSWATELHSGFHTGFSREPIIDVICMWFSKSIVELALLGLKRAAALKPRVSASKGQSPLNTFLGSLFKPFEIPQALLELSL